MRGCVYKRGFLSVTGIPNGPPLWISLRIRNVGRGKWRNQCNQLLGIDQILLPTVHKRPLLADHFIKLDNKLVPDAK